MRGSGLPDQASYESAKEECVSWLCQYVDRKGVRCSGKAEHRLYPLGVAKDPFTFIDVCSKHAESVGYKWVDRAVIPESWNKGEKDNAIHESSR